jgi:hypothetical protein
MTLPQWCGVPSARKALWGPHSFMIAAVNEACMGLHECHQLGVGPRVVGLECLTDVYASIPVGEACEEHDKFAGGRVKCC